MAQERRLALTGQLKRKEIDRDHLKNCITWTDLGVGEEKLQKIVNRAQAKIRLRNDNGEKTEEQ
ncbi:MAG: hypothetical protein H6642_14010 [Caldilineaceae bacterium]|nr:hypothetical protein [Caldilineaceae bacterium]